MNILKHFNKKNHEPRKFENLDEALLTISNLSEKQAGFLRSKTNMTPKQLKDNLVSRLSSNHRMKPSLVTDDMIMHSINATESKHSLARIVFDGIQSFKLVYDHKAKLDQLEAIQGKFDFYLKRQDDAANDVEGVHGKGHDFDTDFSQKVCMFTLHSMVLTAWFENIHPIRKVSETTFAEWLESPESDYFVVTCYIAICAAEDFISTKTEEQEETLHYTTGDIERYAAIRECSGLYYQIKYTQERKDRYQELYEQAETGSEDQVLFELQVFTHDEEIKRLQDRRDSLKELSGGFDL
ncbi:hypothetical protein BCT96_005010 [Vibrio splendidus]|uniref:hypothetical protein n=1 Tax=Vibrio splendidus TaxID=29497 RepID=UPI000C85ABD1|nr:hypothetical protein [Vibrio splendidus]PMI83816.1 hypothetical protein BCU37_13540 [Vibrio splendidus]PMK55338.1 hypothetical protein BCT96_21225 [Vibrio splendidus]